MDLGRDFVVQDGFVVLRRNVDAKLDRILRVQLKDGRLDRLGRKSFAVDEGAVGRPNVFDVDAASTHDARAPRLMRFLIPHLRMCSTENFGIKVAIILAWHGLSVGLSANLDVRA